ncbi:hypothetical protein AAF712_016471, partial [Marasmius tenuissimus]
HGADTSLLPPADIDACVTTGSKPVVSAAIQVSLPVAMSLPHRTKNGSLDEDELLLMDIGIVDVKVVSEAEKEKGEYGQEK